MSCNPCCRSFRHLPAIKRELEHACLHDRCAKSIHTYPNDALSKGSDGDRLRLQSNYSLPVISSLGRRASRIGASISYRRVMLATEVSAKG